MKCTCRIYGEHAPEGAITVQLKRGRIICPRCKGHMVAEGNYEIKNKGE